MLVNMQLLLAVALKTPYRVGKPRDSASCEKSFHFRTRWLVQCLCQLGNVTCSVWWPETHTHSVGILCGEEFALGQGRVSALKHLVLLGWVVLDKAAWEFGTVRVVTALAGTTVYAVQCTDQGLN